MESLEALRRIYNDAISLNEIEEDVEEIKKDYEIIKQDLERLEQENVKLKNQILSLELDTCIPELKKENEKLKQENKELLVNKNVAQGIATKYKKALDIIKIKIIDVFELKYSYSVNEYNIMARNSDFDELIQEEYELLKEVLINDK